MNPDDRKPPLDYRNWTDDRVSRRGNAQSFIFGSVAGMFIAVVGGCFSFQVQIHASTVSKQNQLMVPIFGAIGIVAGVIGAFMLRGARRRFFFAGLLFGIALACLMEGICFFG